MEYLSVEKRLSLVRFNIHSEPHIKIDTSKCIDCDYKPCVKACPAGLFTLDDEGRLHFNYEGCFECGTCRVVCPEEAIEWRYPPGGFGVSLRFG